MILLHVNNKCADQLVHPCSLIGTFVVRSFESTNFDIQPSKAQPHKTRRNPFRYAVKREKKTMDIKWATTRENLSYGPRASVRIAKTQTSLYIRAD